MAIGDVWRIIQGEKSSRFRASLRLDARLLDHVSPLGGLGLYERVVLFGRAARDLRALLGKALLDFQKFETLGERGIQLLDDGFRCAGRCRDPIPERYVHPAEAELGKGRDGREQRMALGARRSQRTDLLRRDER